LNPVHFDPITHFDPETHEIDLEAKSYLLEADADVRDMIPIAILGDGNCLYNSIVCLAGITALTPSELRGMCY
jgi:hypothetical protein